MDKAHLDQLREIVKSHKDCFNCEMPESRLFGMMMAGYTDSSRFYLEAAGEALEQWNAHGEAALVRRIADGSVRVGAALAANELLNVAIEALDVLGEHMTDEDVAEGGCAYEMMRDLKKVIANARGENKDWKFWSSDTKERMQ